MNFHSDKSEAVNNKYDQRNYNPLWLLSSKKLTPFADFGNYRVPTRRVLNFDGMKTNNLHLGFELFGLALEQACKICYITLEILMEMHIKSCKLFAIIFQQQ